MHFSRKVLYPVFCFFAACFLFSCADDLKNQTGSVIFKIDSSLVNKIRDKSSRSLTGTNYSITVSLSGGYSDSKTSAFSENLLISFRNIPVGVTIRAQAVIYENEKTIASGSSKEFTVHQGENKVPLTLNKVEPGEPVDPVDPVDPIDPNPPEPPVQIVEAYLYVTGTGDDTAGDGTQENPLKTIDAACEKIISNGTKNTAWTIYISGEVTGIPKGTSGIDAKYGPSTIPETVTEEHARTILLTGATESESAGEPNDFINRNQAGSANGVSEGTVLFINTKVPVTITNLKITGGYGSGEKAGGINIAKEATLSLGNGALITGNRNPSNGRGGAIHNEGTLFMYGSAVIGDKTNGGKTDESTYTYASDSSSYQTFNNKGMANYASTGGAIYNGNSTDSTIGAKLYLGYKRGEDGTPQKEELTGGLYYNSGTGGAVYNTAGSFVYFDSGTFAWNGTEGGGAAINNSGTVEMTGGQIENNRAIGTNAAYGGGVYNRNSSSVFIMSGGTINHNIAYRFNSYGDESSGGGVYNCGKFYMYGTAVIGEKNASKPASADVEHDSDTKTSAWGNKALHGGGIYNYVNTASNQNGGVYLGYKPDASGNPEKAEFTGGIYYNYSSYTTSSTDGSNQYGGGAIESTGTVKIASGTIAYNATQGYGGAIRYSSSNNHVFEISGGTIKNNTAALNGGAIYIASSNKNILTLSGDVQIPAGEDNRHDIYLKSSKTYYPKITLADSLSSVFAVRLNPGCYDTSMKPIVFDSGVQMTLDEMIEKFDITPETVTETSEDGATLSKTTFWYIDETGALVRFNKDSPDSTGDVVLNDGTAVTGKYAHKMTDDQKQNAVAVIFFAGKTFGNDGRLLGVGLRNTAGETPEKLAWTSSVAYGKSKKIDNTDCKVTNNSSLTIDKATFEGDTDGSDNWQQVCSIVDDENISGNYPAWEWINSYGSRNSITGNFESGWYMPTVEELARLYGNKTLVNDVLEKLGGTPLEQSSDTYYWTSTAGDDSTWTSMTISFNSGMLSNNSKTIEHYVCAIRSFGASVTPDLVTIATGNHTDINVAQNKSGSIITFTADEGYSSYAWSIDGETTDESGTAYSTSNILNLDTTGWAEGTYDLMLNAIKGTGSDRYYSYTAQITVQN